MHFSLARREVIGIALVLVLFCALSLAMQPELLLRHDHLPEETVPHLPARSRPVPQVVTGSEEGRTVAIGPGRGHVVHLLMPCGVSRCPGTLAMVCPYGRLWTDH